MSLAAKGTVLWYWHGTPTAQEDIKKIVCPTGFEIDPGEWGSAESPACLEDGSTTTFSAGRGPATASVPINFTPESHKGLYGHYNTNDTLNFIMGYSDGSTDPQYSTSDFSAPTARSSKRFTGFISNMPESFDPANVVTSTLSLVLNSAPVPTWKS